MSPVLVTREELEDRALAHYRTPGSKNGERLYQYKDGSLTPLGRIHYGVGKAKSAVKDYAKVAVSKDNIEKAGAKAALYEHKAERAKAKAIDKSGDDDAVKKAAKFDKLANKYREKEQKLKEREEKNERSNAEIKKDVEAKIENFNKSVKEKAEERKTENKERNEKLKSEIKEIRTLADEELNKRIDRLQKEKQLAELINERNNREQSEFHRFASKLFKDAAENLAKKSLNMATDSLLSKYRDRMNQHKQDQQSKPNDDGSKSADSSSKPTPQSGNGGGGKFSKPEKSQIRSMAGAGKSVAEIAKALGTTEEKVKGYMSAAGITIS